MNRTPEQLNTIMERGEQVTAIIEEGFGLYFGEPVGFELLGLIAEADARRDHAAEQRRIFNFEEGQYGPA